MTTTYRVGTRGSDLALWQTRWIADRLREVDSSLRIEEIIIKTHGDTATQQLFDANWPVGGFVGAIESALAEGRIDFAVHSYKDLQTAATTGLVIAAVPKRADVHDILVTREAADWAALPRRFRLGTSSPRRAAQFRRVGELEIVPIRGNVPTRIKQVETGELDGVVLAAAGVGRLDIKLRHSIDLPTDRFVPAPAQGALAVQTCEGHVVATLLAALDHAPTRRAVAAERTFLAGVGAGCHVPVGALATLEGDAVSLHAQLFATDAVQVAEGVEIGADPEAVGRTLADRLLQELQELSGRT